MDRALTALVCLLFLLKPIDVSAQTRDLSSRWRTVRSEHFAVHYPEPLGLLARRVLAVAERAQNRLEPIFHNVPKRRVQIVLTDESPSSNGSATAIPYNIIRLFATSPDDLSILGDYDDWMTTLITHEHSHILHFDTIGGIPAIVNKIFGRIWPPNQIQPRWLIEGIATYEESSQTAGGRLRSTMFEMYMRMAVLEQQVVHFDTLNNDTDYWPQSNIWYLYGSRFIQWMTKRWGEQIIGQWSAWYGRRAIPFSVNRMAKRTMGYTFSQLYDLWVADMQKHYSEIAQQVRSKGIVQGERLTHLGQIVRGLRFYNDNELIYYVSDGRADPQIRRLQLNGKLKTEKLQRSRGSSYPVRAPDGTIYYESIDAYKTIFLYYDLFQLNPKTKKRKRLTKGWRARYPDISPDGTHIAFTRNKAGTSSLFIAKIQNISKTATTLIQNERFEQVYTPRFSPDGTKIAYSVWLNGGYRDIHILDLKTGEVTQVTHDRALDTGPAWSPDGKRLYFSSDRTGISNIYWWDTETGDTWQLTNVISGAFTPAPSPDGIRLGYIGYSSRGFDVFMLDLKSTEQRPAQPYIDDRPPPSPANLFNPDVATRYIAAPTLAPRSWSVDLQQTSLGQQLGIQLAGQDAATFHDWRLRLNVAVEKGYVNTDFRYTLMRLPPNVFTNFFRRVSLRDGFIINGQSRTWIEDRYGGRLGIAYSIPRSFHINTVNASYDYSWSRSLEGIRIPLDPNTPVPQLPQTGFDSSITLSWSYSDVRRRTFDMTDTAGRSLAASFSFADPAIGSQFRFIRATWAVRRFIELPWKRHQALAIRYGGGTSYDSRGNFGTFLLGGFPSVSLIDQVLNNEPLDGIALRGYPASSLTGNRFHLLQTEYRFPLVRILRGPGTVPVFWDRMYALVFFDWGNAYFNRLNIREFRKGVGIELLSDFTLGYILPYTLRLGFAYGLDEGGGAQFYFNWGVPF